MNDDEGQTMSQFQLVCNSPDPIIGVFFFVNEPQPEEPEAMEESSLELTTVCRFDTTFGFVVMRLFGA